VETLGEANSLIAAAPAASIEQSLIIPPFDYLKKKFTVLVEGADGESEVTLRSTEALRPEDTKYIVYRFEPSASVGV
jgi:hypothetical protein